MKQYVNGKHVIRATIAGYIVLDGFWIVATIVLVILSIKDPGKGGEIAAIVCAIVSVLWGLWLKGFQLTVTDEFFEYRDGFYRTSKVSINNFSEMKAKWVNLRNLGRTLKIPRIAVITTDGKTAFLINDKPFGIKDLQKIRDALEKAKAAL